MDTPPGHPDAPPRSASTASRGPTEHSPRTTGPNAPPPARPRGDAARPRPLRSGVLPPLRLRRLARLGLHASPRSDCAQHAVRRRWGLAPTPRGARCRSLARGSKVALPPAAPTGPHGPQHSVAEADAQPGPPTVIACRSAAQRFQMPPYPPARAERPCSPRCARRPGYASLRPAGPHPRRTPLARLTCRCAAAAGLRSAASGGRPRLRLRAAVLAHFPPAGSASGSHASASASAARLRLRRSRGVPRGGIGGHGRSAGSEPASRPGALAGGRPPARTAAAHAAATRPVRSP